MTATVLGTGGSGTPTTWAAASSATRPGVAPAGGGLLIAVGYCVTDGGSSSGGAIASSGWSGTAPTWSTPITVHTTGTAGLVMAYSTNAYSGSGGVQASYTGSGDLLCGCSVVELTDLGALTFADVAVSAAPGHAITLSPTGDLIVAAFCVFSTTDHAWTNATELYDAIDTQFGVARGSFALDDSSPANPSATPTTGNRVMAGFSFTAASATLEQAGFRFYDDDADPTTATALAAQNTDLT